jgi:4-amino-4-deoxy-L-arabinose transferase-like glycosyltransferase
VGLLLAKIIFSLNIIWHIFNFPFQTDESEGMIVSEVHLMDAGANLYNPPSTHSFVSAPYPPLYYLLNWPFLHFMGISFKPGRAISLLAAVGISFILYKFAKLLSQNSEFLSINKTNNKDKIFAARLGGIAAALFWATLGLVAFWGDAVKPDITAVFFSLGGVYLAVRWASTDKFLLSSTKQVSSAKEDRYKGLSLRNLEAKVKTERWLYLAAIFFALAVLTKQTAFAGPSAVFVFVLLRRPLAALRFLVVWLGLGFGPMLVMNILSNGGYWWHNVIVHQLPWNWENYWKFTAGFLQSYQIYVLLALVFVVVVLLKLARKILQQPSLKILGQDLALIVVLYLGSATVQGLSVGTYGGNHNHLLEMAAVVCLAAGLTISLAYQWWVADQAKKWQRAAWPIALILLIVQGLGLFVGEAQVKPENFPVLGSISPSEALLNGLKQEFNNSDWLTLQYRVPPQNLLDRLGNVAAILDHYDGLIYSDNASLVLATKYPIYTTDPFTQTHATFYGRWDESGLLAMIKQQKFVAIAGSKIDQDCTLPPIYFSPKIAETIKQYYEVKYHDTECIYLPRK